VIGKALSRATEDSVDALPTAFYQDTPTWVRDRTVAGYVNSCQVNTKIGDPIDAVYRTRLPAASVIAEATSAYQQRRYRDAHRLYQEAGTLAEADDLRVLNGLYVSAWKLGRHAEAEQIFARVVAASLKDKQLGLKILFTPGNVQYITDAQLRAQYPIWLRKVAQQAAGGTSCLAVVGHTSRTGAPELNEALSMRRADAIKQRIEAAAHPLRGRVSAAGVGFRETLIGTGTDDLRDALDRRVEFRVVSCA